MKKLTKITALLLAMVMILAACGGQTTTQAPAEGDSVEETATIGFIYVGPIGDGGWTYAHDEGRQYVEKELGVKTLYK